MTARAGASVSGLDIISLGALIIVVMHLRPRKNRVKGWYLGHNGLLYQERRLTFRTEAMSCPLRGEKTPARRSVA